MNELSTAQVSDVLSRYVEAGQAPGAVALVSRRGDVTVEKVGVTGPDGGPLGRDTIFRIGAITMPIVSAAALMLAEEDRLGLDDPVDLWLPELASRRVIRTVTADPDDTVPAKSPVTLRHLLTNSWGFGLFFGAGDAPLRRAANELRIMNGPPVPESSDSPDEWLRRLGTLPLVHQPGEGWTYSTGADVLGILLARASGQPLEQVLQERVFDPLGMADTGFFVPAEKLDRVPPAFAPDPRSGELHVYDPGQWGTEWRERPTYPSAAGGLVSTVDDLLAFGQLLLAGGRVGADRLLTRRSVADMTSDQLTPHQKATARFFPGFFEQYGWGFGLAVTPSGRFGWDGGLGTSFWVDPTSETIGILMTQRAGMPIQSDLYRDFWAALGQGLRATAP
ncbi:serine hydrolase domain-containing protein [Cryptosporangium aurantiacum]|uniref:CubicO group peptidase, beta-lactamase class C family n=1 Tax=Cryptosporangium aurantiacum TaxID=134849 RepID=A0A1M7RDH9_9ACTN|nr:serine hydrolase domain-containing protein [Cryptosporangium aurantiacum]SHN44212.1 CubicO group peptidase, beta-lactamase class C family [Cryptosporangium aurantiacum]